jgi:hypothetical protein
LACPSADIDSFLEVDEEMELQNLVERVLPENDRCDVKEYLEDIWRAIGSVY